MLESDYVRNQIESRVCQTVSITLSVRFRKPSGLLRDERFSVIRETDCVKVRVMCVCVCVYARRKRAVCYCDEETTRGQNENMAQGAFLLFNVSVELKSLKTTTEAEPPKETKLPIKDDRNCG